MLLADTSVWVSHLRGGLPELEKALLEEQVLCHPFVIGELACGHLKNRLELLSLLKALPQAPLAEQEEVLRFIHVHHLTGMGLGWIDVHLLASAKLAGVPLWTLDKALHRSAHRLQIAS